MILQFENLSGRKLALKAELILEVFEGAEGNAGLVLDLLDKPTVWVKERYKDAFERWKEAVEE